MAHHAGAHKKRNVVAKSPNDYEARMARASQEHDDKAKAAAVGLLFSGDTQSLDNDFGSPRPSGEQPTLNMDAPQHNLKIGEAVKVKPIDNTKRPKKSKDEKAKEAKQRRDLITMEEIEATLERKHYAEDDIDFEQLKAKLQEEEKEKCHEWIDKTIDRLLYNTAILTLICALMSAFACYIFVQLPHYLYSYHILMEVFLTSDHIFEKNSFPRGLGFRIATPLPVVILCMYLVVLYFIYLVNYPKQTKSIHYARVIIFFLLEVYLTVCIVSYFLDAGNVGPRLNNFFLMDRRGIKGMPGNEETGKLKFLDESQQYFGCCGYRNRTEWEDVHPGNYTGSWPLSCCDETTSEIACYPPVEKTVVFFRRPLDEDEYERHENKRLFDDTCYPKERLLCLIIIMLITFCTVVFLILSTWNAVIFLQLSHLVLSKDLEIRHRDQYADFF